MAERLLIASGRYEWTTHIPRDPSNPRCTRLRADTALRLSYRYTLPRVLEVVLEHGTDSPKELAIVRGQAGLCLSDGSASPEKTVSGSRRWLGDAGSDCHALLTVRDGMGSEEVWAIVTLDPAQMLRGGWGAGAARSIAYHRPYRHYTVTYLGVGAEPDGLSEAIQSVDGRPLSVTAAEAGMFLGACLRHERDGIVVWMAPGPERIQVGWADQGRVRIWPTGRESGRSVVFEGDDVQRLRNRSERSGSGFRPESWMFTLEQ